MKLHASGEDYLETILVLQKKLGMVRSVDVARHTLGFDTSMCRATSTERTIPSFFWRTRIVSR